MKINFKFKGKDHQVNENFVDRLITAINPINGYRRLQARVHMALAGGYNGASRTRVGMKGWNTTSNDANSDLIPDLPLLRENSRDLIRNNPLALGVLNTSCTSVVGAGLTVKPEIDAAFLGLSEEEADAYEDSAERLFNLFANSNECDLYRTQNFFELQDLAYRSPLENGDAFVLLPFLERAGSPFGLKIQFIEADRVENKDFSADTDFLAGGVGLDGVGAPKEYHILKTHPGNISGQTREWDVVQAFGTLTGRRNVLHLFTKVRVGQTRGVPYLTPVIEMFKQLGTFTNAELTAATVAGMFTVFIKTEDGDGELDPFAPNDRVGGSATDEDYKLGAGAVVGLRNNQTIETANPGRPNSEFDPFVLAILRQIGVALELPYEILIKHFTASYSASRAALLEAWRYFRKRRVWLVKSFCQPIYEAFIFEQVASGRLKAPGFLTDPFIRQAYLGTRWTGAPQGQIDPKRENEADVIAETRLWKTATQNTIEKTGGDWAKNVKQAAKEQRIREQNGIVTDEKQENESVQPVDPPID